MLEKEIMMEVEVWGDALLYANKDSGVFSMWGKRRAPIVARVRGLVEECPCFRYSESTCRFSSQALSTMYFIVAAGGIGIVVQRTLQIF